VRAWLRGRTFLARSGVRGAGVEGVRGVYVPAWLYGALARTDWAAEIGEEYQVEVEEGSGSNKRRRTETRTEWRSLAGACARRVEDVVVTASRGVPDGELARVQPFDWRAALRATPAVLSGWAAEEATVDAQAGLQAARAAAEAQEAAWLPSFLPGDRHRALRHRTALDRESLDLVLVPLWIFAARYAPDRPPLRILVNGQTGLAGGRTPLSPLKIALLVLGLAGAAALALWRAGVLR
jgi:hypothetical protein